MSDFMLWLHANYIKPQLETLTKESDYALRIELLQGQLDGGGMEDLDKPEPDRRGKKICVFF